MYVYIYISDITKIHERLAPRDGFQRRAAAASLRRLAGRLAALGAQRRGPGEGLSEAPQIPGGRRKQGETRGIFSEFTKNMQNMWIV